MLNAHAQHAADLMVVLEESAAMLPVGDVDRAHLERTARALSRALEFRAIQQQSVAQVVLPTA